MANPVNDVRAGIEVKTVGGKFPLYETGLCHIYNLESLPEDSLSTLAAYDIRDVQIICCEHDAAELWQIPPSTLQSLIQSIHDGDLTFYAWWEFSRERPKGKELALWSEDVTTTGNDVFGVGSLLRAVLNGTLASVNIAELYPLYFLVPGSGEVRLLETGVRNFYDFLGYLRAFHFFSCMHVLSAHVWEFVCESLKPSILRCKDILTPKIRSGIAYIDVKLKRVD